MAQSLQHDAARGIAWDNPGPRNPALAAQNPASEAPPATDHGEVPGFKHSFSLAHKRVEEGGWARQITVRDFPISTTLAAVNMRLTAGSIRELHWHKPAEWSFMLYGEARITAVDQNGGGYVQDVRQGDLWYFPSGIPHSIQGLGPDGCEFLLIFDDGNFSEYETFLITDWMAHVPRKVLAKNFAQPASTFDPIPGHELYIFPGQVPGPLAEDRRQAKTMQFATPRSFDFPLHAQPPLRHSRGGEVRIADSRNFPVSATIAAALVTVHPGGLRELHWHPNADEWQYYIAGQAHMTVFAAGGRARTMDFEAGDVGYIPHAMGHYIENLGDTDLRFLEVFRSDHYADISLVEWMAHTPPDLVAAHLHLSRDVLDALPERKPVVLPGEQPGVS